MELKFKKIKSYKTSKDNADVYFDAALKSIKEMTKLYNIPHLKDAALVDAASSYYELKLDGADYTVLAGMALKSQDLETKRLNTSINARVDEENVNLDAVVYAKQGSAMQQNKIYSKEELQSLVANGDIVIAYLAANTGPIRAFAVPGNLEEIKDLSPINGISLNNLGIYQRFLVTSIKRQLSLERISKDVDTALSQVRGDLTDYRALLQDKMNFLASYYNDTAIEAMVLRDYDLALGQAMGGGYYYQSSVFTSEDCDYGVTPSTR